MTDPRPQEVSPPLRDSLAVVSHDLSCRGKGGLPDEKLLSAKDVAEVCAAIDEAVASLRRILEIADAVGSGPLHCS